jgi:hypothetical protein
MRWPIAFIVVSLGGSLQASPPEKPVDPPSAEELASIMRTLLTSALPEPLVEQSSNWGKQKEVANGITWKKDGLLLKPHKQEKLKNDGVWRRIRIDAVNPEKELKLQVMNVQKPQKGMLTFDMVVTLPTRIKFEQQFWKNGVRIYSGETRARCRPVLALKCESTSRVVKSDNVIPDVVFRMRVLDARLTYDDLVVEHTAGVGGELADVLGDAVHGMVKQMRPSLERDMLEKANRAIVKAGDTKEVKLGLGKLFDGK